jgi:Glycosyl hydrolase catalytic core
MSEQLLNGTRSRSRARRLLLLLALSLAFVALALPGSAPASKQMMIGLFDDASTFGAPTTTFPLLESLHVQVVRLTLTWGGRDGVADERPAHPNDPADPAYRWARYDQVVEEASHAGIQVLFTIIGTPDWANGGQGPRVAPRSTVPLRQFAYAAALRYSGTFLDTASGRILPRVNLWLAWNEPNNSVFLRPQFVRSNGRWKFAAAAAYARICNAIYTGVHAAGGPERVACGATAPRGYNDPRSARPSTAPIAFLRAAKAAGLRRFDAWAHHPYYSFPRETPTTHLSDPHGVGFGDLDRLIGVLTQLYGAKPLWITEYGYQTNPPDTFYGVSWQNQAAYLREAYKIARANPRIDLLTWFLLKDSASLPEWQSGLLTASGRKKPAFAAYEGLRTGGV